MSTTADQELAELRRANAELQRANAKLQKERDAALTELQARTRALVQRDSEYGERIQQQAATIDVLNTMSASPGDAQPVFKLIVERARAFCHADQANLALLDGDMLHLKATTGSSASYPGLFPLPVHASITFGRAITGRDTVQTPDLHANPDHFRRTIDSQVPVRAIVAVPLLRSGTPVGAIVLGRNVPGEFSSPQVDLLRTFAEQAVIAIISAETYRALQVRTSDLQQSLEYQTATSDVLKVISRSGAELQAVLGNLVQTAARLCDAQMALIHRLEGGVYRPAAVLGFPLEFTSYLKANPLVPGWGSIAGRVAMEGRAVHIPDVTADPEYELSQSIVMANQRTALGVPLLREDELIGVIVLARQRVKPFSEKEIELVSTFADQAVIAIENTRLITEQREALEQQTATTEVLQVINSSPGNLMPVFDAMLERAMRLCEASFGELYSFEDEVFHPVAFAGVPQLMLRINKNAEIGARSRILARWRLRSWLASASSTLSI